MAAVNSNPKLPHRGDGLDDARDMVNEINQKIIDDLDQDTIESTMLLANWLNENKNDTIVMLAKDATLGWMLGIPFETIVFNVLVVGMALEQERTAKELPQDVAAEIEKKVSDLDGHD